MWIEALRVEGGILDGLEQRFSRNLNVLIGARGTGKSSVIELIRFCLAASSPRRGTEPQSTEHALGVLGDGKVTVTLSNGTSRIDISRTALDGGTEERNSFDVPFVFSQAEIEGIGLRSQSRLGLLDGFLPPLLTERTASPSMIAKISSITVEIRGILAEIDDIEEKTAELPMLRASRDLLKSQAAAQTAVHTEIEIFRRALDEITPTHAAAHVRAGAITRAVNDYYAWLESLENVIEHHPHFAPWPAQAGKIDELSDFRIAEKRIYDRIKGGLAELLVIGDELQGKQSAAMQQSLGLDNRARDLRQKIEENQKGASALDKQIGDFAQRISVLESLVELHRDRKMRVAGLIDQRLRMLAENEVTRQRRTNERERAAQRLNRDLGPAIRLTVMPYSQRFEYISALTAALRGSGLRYAELAERISETYSPIEIAHLAENRDTQAIVSGLKITTERAVRLCDALRDKAGGALFTTVVEDDVQVELLDGSNYKGVDFLSTGQRCTVILPIILRHLDRMIVLDQPEDHLDNSFVVETLVEGIIKRANHGQTIVATHNANIPVLGDAEMVVHLDSDGNRCFVRASGSIDKPAIVAAITGIMEGGRAAFLRRAEFYAKNLPNAPKS